MVAGKDEPVPPPQKKSGIEVVMWPLNPDGSWKNGMAPPKLPKPGLRSRNRRPRFEEQMFPRLRTMTSQLKEVRLNLAREALRKITIRQVAGETLPRLELSSARSESPTLVIEPADADDDSDSFENVIFIQDASLEQD